MVYDRVVELLLLQSDVCFGTKGTQGMFQQFSQHAIGQQVSDYNCSFVSIIQIYNCKQVPVGLLHAWQMAEVVLINIFRIGFPASLLNRVLTEQGIRCTRYSLQKRLATQFTRCTRYSLCKVIKTQGIDCTRYSPNKVLTEECINYTRYSLYKELTAQGTYYTRYSLTDPV